MTRNYEKEAAWLKSKYTDLRARVDKTLADDLKKSLEESNITYAQWLKNQIAAYLKEQG